MHLETLLRRANPPVCSTRRVLLHHSRESPYLTRSCIKRWTCRRCQPQALPATIRICRPSTTRKQVRFGRQPINLKANLQKAFADFLSSEVCYPSTSSYESSVYDPGFLAGTSTIPPDDPHHHLQLDDEDDDLYGEPERYDTMSPTFSIHSFAPTTSTNTAEAEDLEVRGDVFAVAYTWHQAKKLVYPARPPSSSPTN